MGYLSHHLEYQVSMVACRWNKVVRSLRVRNVHVGLCCKTILASIVEYVSPNTIDGAVHQDTDIQELEFDLDQWLLHSPLHKYIVVYISVLDDERCKKAFEIPKSDRASRHDWALVGFLSDGHAWYAEGTWSVRVFGVGIDVCVRRGLYLRGAQSTEQSSSVCQKSPHVRGEFTSSYLR